MKDAKGHGSDPRGTHASGVNALGETRYHTTKRAYWERAQRTGFLNPNSYTTKKIWTSTHDDDHYSRMFNLPFNGLADDEVQLAITTHPKNYLPTPGNEGGGSADRVTKVKIPIANIREVKPSLPSRVEYAKQSGQSELLKRVSKGGWSK